MCFFTSVICFYCAFDLADFGAAGRLIRAGAGKLLMLFTFFNVLGYIASVAILLLLLLILVACSQVFLVVTSAAP